MCVCVWRWLVRCLGEVLLAVPLVALVLLDLVQSVLRGVRQTVHLCAYAQIRTRKEAAREWSSGTARALQVARENEKQESASPRTASIRSNASLASSADSVTTACAQRQLIVLFSKLLKNNKYIYNELL